MFVCLQLTNAHVPPAPPALAPPAPGRAAAQFRAGEGAPEAGSAAGLSSRGDRMVAPAAGGTGDLAEALVIQAYAGLLRRLLQLLWMGRG